MRRTRAAEAAAVQGIDGGGQAQGIRAGDGAWRWAPGQGMVSHDGRMLAREWQTCPLGDIFASTASGEDGPLLLLLEPP
jgi:hypothetical protein